MAASDHLGGRPTNGRSSAGFLDWNRGGHERRCTVSGADATR